MNKERLIESFMNMVRIGSESHNEGEFAAYLIGELKGLGFEVCTDDAGVKAEANSDNIIAKLKGTMNVPAVMFCAHLDTVKPGVNIKPIIKDNAICSDGTTILGGDDKAGIAAIIEAIRHIKENNIPHGDIEAVFTVCEEIGLVGSKNLDYSKVDSKMAFVLDSGGDVGGVIVKGPTQTKIHALINGKAAHAGVSPELGISAIQVAARAIENMSLLRIDEETTANVGTINGASSASPPCSAAHSRS